MNEGMVRLRIDILSRLSDPNQQDILMSLLLLVDMSSTVPQ